MSQRVNFYASSPVLVDRLTQLSMALKESRIPAALKHLVNTRASQINGCAFCVDMHVKEATIDGERALRLLHLPIWQESNLFTSKERAALLWTEVVTKLSHGPVSDEVYNEVRKEFSAEELSDLTFVIATINTWNRLAATFLSVPGSADKLFGIDKSGLN